jgi:hypothetical protein
LAPRCSRLVSLAELVIGKIFLFAILTCAVDSLDSNNFDFAAMTEVVEPDNELPEMAVVTPSGKNYFLERVEASGMPQEARQHVGRAARLVA